MAEGRDRDMLWQLGTIMAQQANIYRDPEECPDLITPEDIFPVLADDIPAVETEESDKPVSSFRMLLRGQQHGRE